MKNDDKIKPWRLLVSILIAAPVLASLFFLSMHYIHTTLNLSLTIMLALTGGIGLAATLFFFTVYFVLNFVVTPKNDISKVKTNEVKTNEVKTNITKNQPNNDATLEPDHSIETLTLEKIPQEALFEIFLRLNVDSILLLSRTSKKLNEAIEKDNYLWKKLIARDFENFSKNFSRISDEEINFRILYRAISLLPPKFISQYNGLIDKTEALFCLAFLMQRFPYNKSVLPAFNKFNQKAKEIETFVAENKKSDYMEQAKQLREAYQNNKFFKVCFFSEIVIDINIALVEAESIQQIATPKSQSSNCDILMVLHFKGFKTNELNLSEKPQEANLKPNKQLLDWVDSNHDIDKLNFLLQSDANINVRNNDYFAAIHIALLNYKKNPSKHRKDILHAIVSANPDLNANCQHGTPMQIAAGISNHFALDLLLKHKADVNLATSTCIKPPIIIAANQGCHKNIKLLLNNEDVKVPNPENQPSLLFEASFKGNGETAKVIIDHFFPFDINNGGMNQSISVQPGQNGNNQILKLVRPNPAPMIIATLNGNLEIVRTLLNNGADPKIVYKVHNSNSEIEKISPLNIAVRRGNIKILRLLISTDKYSNEEIYEVFKIATFWRRVEIVDLLFQEKIIELEDNLWSEIKETLLSDPNMLIVYIKNATVWIKKNIKDIDLINIVKKSIEINEIELTELILERFNIPKEEINNLLIKVHSKDSKYISLLLRSGANIEHKTKYNNYTILQLSVKTGNFDNVKFLLGKKPNPSVSIAELISIASEAQIAGRNKDSDSYNKIINFLESMDTSKTTMPKIYAQNCPQ